MFEDLEYSKKANHKERELDLVTVRDVNDEVRDYNGDLITRYYEIQHGITFGSGYTMQELSIGDTASSDSFYWDHIRLPDSRYIVGFLERFGKVELFDGPCEIPTLEDYSIDEDAAASQRDTDGNTKIHQFEGGKFQFDESIPLFIYSLIERFLEPLSRSMRLTSDEIGNMFFVPNPPQDLRKESWWLGEYFDTAQLFQHICTKFEFETDIEVGQVKRASGKTASYRLRFSWEQRVKMRAEKEIIRDLRTSSNNVKSINVSKLSYQLIDHFTENSLHDGDGRRRDPPKFSTVHKYITELIKEKWPELHSSKK